MYLTVVFSQATATLKINVDADIVVTAAETDEMSLLGSILYLLRADGPGVIDVRTPDRMTTITMGSTRAIGLPRATRSFKHIAYCNLGVDNQRIYFDEGSLMLRRL